MTKLKIYLYANCSSCRKADTALAESGLDYDRRDIFKERLSAPEIRDLLGTLGNAPAYVLSRRSIPYRELDLADKSLTDDQLIDLMAEHPALLRRPIVVSGEASLVGFSERALNDLIAQAGAN